MNLIWCLAAAFAAPSPVVLQPRQQPLTPAPFWEQPLIVDYIAGQHPGNSMHCGAAAAPEGGTLRCRTSVAAAAIAGGAISKALASDAASKKSVSISEGGSRKEAAAPAQHLGETRIRTVKMRGGGHQGGTLHAGVHAQCVR